MVTASLIYENKGKVEKTE